MARGLHGPSHPDILPWERNEAFRGVFQSRQRPKTSAATAKSAYARRPWSSSSGMLLACVVIRHDLHRTGRQGPYLCLLCEIRWAAMTVIAIPSHDDKIL